MPRSSISNSTSPPSLSGVTLNTGVVMTLATGALRGRPAATIRVRMSRSVTIPISNPSPELASTIAEVAPASVIRRATSRIDSIGLQVTVAERINPATGWCPGSCTPTISSRARARSSSGRATATGIR